MPKIMWQPTCEQIKNSQLTEFISNVNRTHYSKISNYPELYNWSIQEKEKFWNSFSQFAKINFSRLPETILVPGCQMYDAKWFLDARLNFAENLLKYNNENIALIFNDERNRRRQLSYRELYYAVASLAQHFKKMGLKTNDRVAAILPNQPEAVIAMLATTSLGAVWSSCSPEFGQEALFERFHQIKPKILIASDGYFYNGKSISNSEKITWLRDKLPSIKQLLIVDSIQEGFTRSAINFESLLIDEASLKFEQLPFNHPVYIMYSSGTTGVPKCIVHGAGGTLLQHLKELILHVDLRSNDKIFYYTTCGWMMWNWYISSLSVGATIIQYDGSAFKPTPKRLWDLIDQEKISVFGTSAKYISTSEKENLTPKQTHQLISLRTILSTGSPLVGKNFDYVYKKIKTDVCLSSISGGTDIISCFALGNPILPVYRGELQCIGLGMAVHIFDEDQKSVINQKGELVCTEPFPSMPIYFWNDPGNKKYQSAYFEKFKDVWAHGDYAKLTDRGTLIIYGRSDATLNPGGVRIGTAEIYRQVEKMPEVTEALAVNQEWDGDNRIILFVVLAKGYVLSEELISRIKSTLKKQCSPRHVPAKIFAVPELPRTLSDKIVELAVRDIIHGRPVKNISALANPESLDYFKKLDL